MTKYLFTLLFPTAIDQSKVTQVGFQVTGDPAIEPPLAQNKMPAQIDIGDTLTFTYQQANPNVTMDSCLLTQYNVTTSQKETDLDFSDDFDKPITVTDAWVGSWVFHLLGMYKTNDTNAAFYLDPEVTVSNQ
ncbi:hypothetical protein GCM10011613_11430 [Cellvibrio zantedeschiae]|uniref:Uncharacterized protein n=1 Tax=Cellvibrio zantedeschiae TaxID=1237077 RepID=A0ABQ3AV38_9GAMM|nr:hypothetical protein [Cellvibrio zantedeschiae]GGY68838.1 hypothetical protein GCM10011613_11430 [Cellvibrio zantedeschiae]